MLIFVGLGVGLVGWLLSSWFFMLVAGAVHHDVWSGLPAFGFWQSVLVVLLVSIVGTVFNSSTLSRSKS